MLSAQARPLALVLAPSGLWIRAVLVVIYVFGLAALSRFPLPNGVLETGLLPFLIGDAYKVALAALALPAAWRFLPGLRAAK